MGHGASICTLAQGPDRVKGGPEENAPGLCEVIMKKKKAGRWGSVPNQAWGPSGIELSKWSNSHGWGGLAAMEMSQSCSRHICVTEQERVPLLSARKTKHHRLKGGTVENIIAFQMEGFLN